MRNLNFCYSLKRRTAPFIADIFQDIELNYIVYINKDFVHRLGGGGGYFTFYY